MKRIAAALVTVALLGVVLYVGRTPPSTGGEPATTPEQCLERMFQAAERGDIDTYLDCFTGSERQQIERTRASQTREAFARSLVEALQPLKGRAIISGPADAADPRRAEVSVERIYAHRNELQAYQLRREADVWRIETVRAAEPFSPPVPFGTQAFQ